MKLGAVLLGSALSLGAIHADDWPQWFGPQRDGEWREKGTLSKFPKDGPKRLWRTEIGAGYSGPAIADGKVFVTDRVAEKITGNPARAGTSPGKERVLCLDARTGAEIWKHEYDCTYKRISYGFGPRTTPTVVKDRVYVLGTMGDLKCLNVADGKVLWSKNFVADLSAPVPIWGWSSSPLVDGDRLYCLVGGEKQAVVCFNRMTGDKLWSALTTEEIGYVPPVIFEAGGKRQLIIWHTESINSLNPETGEKYWGEKYPKDVPVARPSAPISTPRLAGDLLYISSFYHGSLALKLDGKEPKATVAWRGNSEDPNKASGLCCLMSTPLIRDGHIYGISRTGELMCLKLNDGTKLWETLDHQGGKKTQFGTAFIIPHGDRQLLFTDVGDLIIARLTPKGYEQISRANIIKPLQANSGRDVVWTHPAFANQCIFVRNDQEIVCVSMKE